MVLKPTRTSRASGCRKARRGALPGAFAALLVLGLVAVGATAGSPTEYELKAAFLYNFAKFVEWPPEAIPTPDAPLTLCVLGEDPFKGALERTVAGRRVAGRALEVRRLATLQEVDGCQILFVPGDPGVHPGDLAPRLEGASVLTVGESERFALHGGVLNFTRRGNKIGFEINPAAAAAAQLRVSSKLLQLATIVEPVGPAEQAP